MENLITFLENSDIEKSAIFSQLKCSLEEANILKNLTHKYIEGCEEVTVLAILKEIYTDKNYIHIKKVYIIKNLLRILKYNHNKTSIFFEKPNYRMIKVYSELYDIKIKDNLLIIKDYGKGMDANELLKIYDRYYQGDKSYKGSGIGLSVVKEFCDNNKIEIRINSTPNIGTTVILDFRKLILKL